MPFFLEDRTGDLKGSEFVDIYNRLRFSIRCTLRSPEHTAYMVYDLSTTSSSSRGGLLVPIACLDFGVNHGLGTVKIGEKEHVQMSQYLAKISRRYFIFFLSYRWGLNSFYSSKARRFIASDGQEYRWTHQAGSDSEWQVCVTSESPTRFHYL